MAQVTDLGHLLRRRASMPTFPSPMTGDRGGSSVADPLYIACRRAEHEGSALASANGRLRL